MVIPFSKKDNNEQCRTVELLSPISHLINAMPKVIQNRLTLMAEELTADEQAGAQFNILLTAAS